MDTIHWALTICSSLHWFHLIFEKSLWKIINSILTISRARIWTRLGLSDSKIHDDIVHPMSVHSATSPVVCDTGSSQSCLVYLTVSRIGHGLHSILGKLKGERLPGLNLSFLPGKKRKSCFRFLTGFSWFVFFLLRSLLLCF